MDTLWKTFHICDLISPITELVWLFPIVIQSLSHDRLCNPMDCSMPGFPVLHGFLEFAQTHVIELVMPSNHHFLCHPLLLLLSIFPSIRVFSNELALPKWQSRSTCICLNTKITTSCWTATDRRMLECTKKNIPQVQGQRRRCNEMVGGMQSC